MFRCLRSKQIDGSRLTLDIHPFNAELTQEALMWYMLHKNKDDTYKITLGYLYNNTITINPFFIAIMKYKKVKENKMLKEICNIISHEFLHMMLYHQFNKKHCDNLDNICKYVDDAHTECGGL